MGYVQHMGDMVVFGDWLEIAAGEFGIRPIICVVFGIYIGSQSRVSVL